MDFKNWLRLAALQFFPSIKLSVGLWRDVTNFSEFREKIADLQKTTPSTSSAVILLNADPIMDLVQINCAATHALMRHSTECQHLQPVTRGGISTEIIYFLSGGRSLQHAFNTFSVTESTTSILICLVYIPELQKDGTWDEDKSKSELCEWQSKVAEKIVGRCIPADRIQAELSDNIESAKQAYDITALEEEHILSKASDRHQAYTNSILTRMNVKEFLRI